MFGAVALLIVLLALWRGLLWRPRPLLGVRRERPLLIGHRGVRGSLPENTLAAFRRAFDASLDGIEFDVQQTRDGVLVLYHDFALPDGREVAALSYAELLEHKPDLARLDEFLALCRTYPGTLVNLEIKSRGVLTKGLERRIAQAVQSSGLGDRLVVSSFNPLSLLKLRLYAPHVRTALLFTPELPPLLRTGGLAPWLHVDALHPHFSQVDAKLMAKARARGLMVNVWTVNDPQEVARLAALGVDGIIADDPDSLKRAVGRE
jgi:glycerophosphoryl diester phosphodiesterase